MLEHRSSGVVGRQAEGKARLDEHDLRQTNRGALDHRQKYKAFRISKMKTEWVD